MAILTLSQRAKLRRDMAAIETVVDYDKTTINLALQAIEDWFEANRSGIGTAINTATSPFIFTAQQKRRMVKFWLRQKFERESV